MFGLKLEESYNTFTLETKLVCGNICYECSDSGWYDRSNKLSLKYVLNDSDTMLRSEL